MAQKKLHVFAVEDHPISQIVLSEQLKQLGCRVTMAADGREALDVWQRGLRFDVLLTDVNMPRLDGYQLVRKLRKGGVKVPIVGVTANGHAVEGERCREAGMNTHLVKPVSLSSLRDALEAVGAVFHPQRCGKSTSNIVLTLNELKPAMREFFVLTTKADWSSMMFALANGHAAGVIQHAHRLKGSLATIGEMAAAHMCSKIESHAQLGPLTKMNNDVQNLAQYLRPILE